jgi:hypothetical protein
MPPVWHPLTSADQRPVAARQAGRLGEQTNLEAHRFGSFADTSRILG